MKAAVTEKWLRSLLAKDEPHEPIWDEIPPHLEWRKNKRDITGSVVGRIRGSGIRQPIRLLAGHFPTTPLAEIRQHGRKLRHDLDSGIDPRAIKRERLQAEAAERAGQFAAVAEQFIKRLAEKRTARAIELRIRRELIARWSDRPISKISRADVADMILEIAERSGREAARQTFTYARRLFRWAVARGLLEYAPTDHLNVKDLIGAKKSRQRLLTEHELKLIWRAAAQTPYPDGPYIQLLLLLGVRRSELGQATWSEIDLDRGIWVIGPARMKSDEGHTVPLPARAVQILRALPRFASDYVFSSRGNRPLNDFGAVKQRLDRRIAELNGGRPIEAWTFHDCRRSFRTGLSTQGLAPHVAELCLAHRQPGLARVYDLHKFDAEKRHALNAWAAHLLSVVEPSPDNVVQLRKMT
jgi:integrase